MNAKTVEESHKGHVVLSPERVLKDNSHIIINLLEKIANAYKVSKEDAAFALQQIMKNFIG